MYVNTEVVRALMSLRRIDEATLANIANVSAPAFSKWLHDRDGSDELIAFDTQLEILRVLGINGETPRSDIVHYWFIYEPLMSRSASNYWALSVLTAAFGKADAVYFAKESDPIASMRSKSHFGLQFPSFKAVVEVTSHPLRNVGFDPANIKDVQWAPGNFGVLVNQAEFERIAPGLLTPALFDSRLNVGREQLAWERLNLLARDHNIGAAQIEKLLLSVQQELKTPKLTVAVESTEAEPVQTPVAPRAPEPPAEASPAHESQASVQSPAPAVPPTPRLAPRPAPRPVPAAADRGGDEAAADANLATAHGLLRSTGDDGAPRPQRRPAPRPRGHNAAPRSPWHAQGSSSQE